MYRCRWVNMQEWQLFKKNKTPKQWQIKVYTRVGQYPGITTHLVEIYDLTLCHVKEVGQHVGMMGQHKQEWWVNMVRNLQTCRNCGSTWQEFIISIIKKAVTIIVP